MIRLTKEQVIKIHSALIAKTGGIDGIRDENLLESSLNSPFQSFDGVELYPSLMQKAAWIGYSLISNHPFIDGNKRIGIHIMLVFLSLNGIELNYAQEELIDIGLKLAAGKMKAEELIIWLNSHN
jgi:death-on-curing protein